MVGLGIETLASPMVNYMLIRSISYVHIKAFTDENSCPAPTGSEALLVEQWTRNPKDVGSNPT